MLRPQGGAIATGRGAHAVAVAFQGALALGAGKRDCGLGARSNPSSEGG